MLAGASRSQGAPNLSASPTTPLRTKGVAPWRGLALAALSSLVFVVANLVYLPAGALAASVFGGLNEVGLTATTDEDPPDTTGSIGPKQYIEMVNEEAIAYERATLKSPAPPITANLWELMKAPKGEVTDPQIKYDPWSQRWFYSAARTEQKGAKKTENELYVGFSKTAQPANFKSDGPGEETIASWCGYAYKTGTPTKPGERFEDQPKLGLDEEHIIIGTNSIEAEGPFKSARIYSLPKNNANAIVRCEATPALANLVAGKEPLKETVEAPAGGEPEAWAPNPATVADHSKLGYVVATPREEAGVKRESLMLWRVAGAAPPKLEEFPGPKVGEFQKPASVKQPENGEPIKTSDGRLKQAVAAADPTPPGKPEAVWTEHTVKAGPGAAVRWYELVPPANAGEKAAVRQGGTIERENPTAEPEYTFNGAIAPTLGGGAVINYDRVGVNEKEKAGGGGEKEEGWVQIWARSRSRNTPLNGMERPIKLAASRAIASAQACEPEAEEDCRWGDYAGASVDPTNGNLVWGSNELDGNVKAGNKPNWETQNFALEPCLTPLFASGSPLQNAAQAVFKANWPKYTQLTKLPNPPGCEGEALPSTFYTATLDSEALEVFGVTGALQARLDPTVKKREEHQEPCGPVKIPAGAGVAGECLDFFIGSDLPPTTAQLTNATTASGGKSNKNAGEAGHRATVVIPVAQGPVAAMLSLPAGCKVETKSRINLTNEAFQQLWAGKGAIKAQGGYPAGTWGAFLTQLGYTKVGNEGELSADPSFTEVSFEESLARSLDIGEQSYTVHTKAEIEQNEPPEKVKLPTQIVDVKSEGCNQQIKANVRSFDSGTSYATKAYFNQIEPAVWAGFLSEAAQWPEEGWVVRENLSTSGNEAIKNESGSQLAENAAATPGSVGYADTADAAKGGGSTSRVTLSQRPSPETATLSEVVQNGLAENGTTHLVEEVFEVKREPVQSIKHEILYAALQNNGVKPKGEAGTGPTFAFPLIEDGTNRANCETGKLISGDNGTGGTKVPAHWNESWNGVLASDPNSAGTVGPSGAEVYPVCALTYDITWHHFRNEKLYGDPFPGPIGLSGQMASVAKDYFEYVSGQGRTDFNNGYYDGPPIAMSLQIKAAVAQIGP